MATTIKDDDLNQNKSNNSGQQNQVGIFPSNQPQTQQQFNPNQQRGTGYTNIQRIITANQGNKLGQNIGQGIQQAGQQVQQNLGQQQQQFNQQTGQNQANTGANQQLVGNVLSNASQYAPTGQNDANAQTGAKFQQLIGGQYQGPMSLQSPDQLQQQASDVGQMGNALNTAGGRMALLQRFAGGPQYTTGQQTLDSLLLGKSTGDLINAKKSIAGLPSAIGRAVGGSQEQGKEQTSGATEFGKQVQGQFGQKVSDIDTGLQKAATEGQSKKDTAYKQAIEDLKSGDITQDEADLLGVGQGQEVTNDMLQNVGNYLTEDPTKASAQNIATGQDYSTMNALRQLAGQNSPEAAQKLLGTYSGQDAQAGKFTTAPTFQSDKSGFQSGLGSQISQYHSQLDPVKQQRDAAQDIVNLVNKRDSNSNRIQELSREAMNYAPNDPYRSKINQEMMNLQKEADSAQENIRQNYPGAVSNGTTRADWANSLLQGANQKFNATQAALQQAYGGLKNINIKPKQS